MNNKSLFVYFCLACSVFAQTPVDTQLQNKLESSLRAHKGDVAVAIRHLSSGVHYEFNADTPLPTASLIKFPIMITAYRQVDSGKLQLTKQVRLSESDKVPGSGILTEHFSSEISLPLTDYVRLMIRYSDNTATNIVIDQIGLPSTTETMESLGANETRLHSKLYRGDTSIAPNRSMLFGIGSTTANEMVDLLVRFENNELASPESTAAMRDHLLKCEDATKLAANLPKEVKIAHKTGAIANCRTDAGLIYTSQGPVAVCFLTNKNEDQTWDDSNAANRLAAIVGEAIVERFGAPAADNRLREGAFGRLVETLQRTLNKRLTPSPQLAIDGDFGPATRRAVEQFQRAMQLPQSGTVDQETWHALGRLVEEDDPVPDPTVVNNEVLSVESQPDLANAPIVTAKSWAIADATTGKIEFGHEINRPLEAASTTKIMTAYLVVRFAEQNPEVLNERVVFSSRADNTVGSTSGLRAGESVTVRELLFGLMLPSGNDASVALAEHFGTRLSHEASDGDADVDLDEQTRSYNAFIHAMNDAAKELELHQAHYVNPHGLSNPAHVISAADLIRLTQAASKLELFRELSSTRQFGCVAKSQAGYERNVIWKNTNELLNIEGYSGVKTGTTSAAGACLVAKGSYNGDELLVVVLGSSSSPSRYADIRNLFRWAWSNRTK
ncbi:MAG: serine hydrolase [Planctomycetales bacterium]|nr:serine hydrolase [Planctomycetales bacterium]